MPRLPVTALLSLLALVSVRGAPAKYFFIDPSWIAGTINVSARLGAVRKDPLNPLFGEDYPWEPRYDNMYPNVIFDREERVYKCWYSPFIVAHVDETQSVRPNKARWYDRSSAVCYAVSIDGLHWRKPMFPEFPFEGRPSNIVYRDVHGVGVFKDARDPDETRRYKMLFNWEKGPPGNTLAVAFSRDGIHWGEPHSLPGISLKADTHNNAIWSESLHSYLAITRDWDNSRRNAPIGIRVVSRLTSPDFIHWSPPREILRGADPDHQTYAMPVLEDSGIFFGFIATIHIKEDRVHTELAWSHDSVHWQRVCPGTDLIPNGERGSYDYGCLFPAAVPLQTPDGIRFYYAGSDGLHGGFRRGALALATLRTDGFAGLTNTDPIQDARVRTFAFAHLRVSSSLALGLAADVAPGGYVTVEARDPASGVQLGRATVEGPMELNPTETVGLALKSSRLTEAVELDFTFKRSTLYSLTVPRGL